MSSGGAASLNGIFFATAFIAFILTTVSLFTPGWRIFSGGYDYNEGIVVHRNGVSFLLGAFPHPTPAVAYPEVGRGQRSYGPQNRKFLSPQQIPQNRSHPLRTIECHHPPPPSSDDGGGVDVGERRG